MTFIKLRKLTSLIILAIVFSVVAMSCAETQVNTDPVEPEVVKPEPAKEAPKKVEKPKGDPTISWVGGEEELFTTLRYPGFWKLNVVPGIKKTPGIEKPDSRYCVLNLNSLDAKIVITVKEGTSDLKEIVAEAKNKIFTLYPESYFNVTSPKLVKVGEVDVEGQEGTKEIKQADMPKHDGQLPHIEGTTSYVESDEYNYEEGSGKKATSLPSEIFKRNEVWKDGEENWMELKARGSDKIAGVLPVKYQGQFIYDQTLYFVMLRAANVKEKTVYALYICPEDSVMQYLESFYRINQKINFKK